MGGGHPVAAALVAAFAFAATVGSAEAAWTARTTAASAAGEGAIGLVWRPGAHEIARLEARSLRPLRGRRVSAGRHGPAWSFAPDGSRLALGGNRSVRLVDVRAMRLLGDVRIDGVGYVVATWWPQGGRLFVLQQYHGEPWRQAWLVEIDPARRTVVRRTALRGSAEDVARTGDSLVVLMAPARGLGPARLALVGRSGGIRFVQLSAVLAGHSFDGDVMHVSRPALVADSRGRRAFVVAGAALAAVVDLQTFEVAYRRLRAPRWLVRRLLDWLSPPAWAKAPSVGPMLEAERVTDDVIAVSGSNGRTRVGLMLVDVRRGLVRAVDRDAGRVRCTAGIALAHGGARGDVRAYDARGTLLWSRPGHTVELIDASRSRVLVHRGGRPLRSAVLDARSGRVLEHLSSSAGQPFPRREGSGWE